MRIALTGVLACAALLASPAIAGDLPPSAASVGPPAVVMIVPLTSVGVKIDPNAYSSYGDRPTTENYVASDGLLAHVLRLSVRDKYEASQSTGGFYVGPSNSAKLGELPAISVVAITPSEVFRDTSAEWDKYGIVAAVQFSPFSEATNSAVLWVVARNYLHRNRGGITFGASGPSPDWSFDALTDFDTTNARLEKIQEGLKAVVDEEAVDVGPLTNEPAQ